MCIFCGNSSDLWNSDPWIIITYYETEWHIWTLWFLAYNNITLVLCMAFQCGCLSTSLPLSILLYHVLYCVAVAPSSGRPHCLQTHDNIHVHVVKELGPDFWNITILRCTSIFKFTIMLILKKNLNDSFMNSVNIVNITKYINANITTVTYLHHLEESSEIV